MTNKKFSTKKHIKYEEEQRSKNKKIYKMLENFYNFILQSNDAFCKKKSIEEQNKIEEIYFKYYDKQDEKYKPIIKLFKKFQKIFREYIKAEFEKETPDLEYDFLLLKTEVWTNIVYAKENFRNKIDFNINDLINDTEKFYKNK